MRKLTLDDLIDADGFEAVRPRLREAVIAHKRDRRVPIGDRVTLVFEDRETLRWQVLEMARVERLASPEALQAELDVYNELIPGEDELSATLFIEIPELDAIRPELDRLIGIDEHVRLRLGSGPDATEVPARFDPKQMEEDRISAVQYLRFPLGPRARECFLDPAVPASLAIEHPNYRAETELSPEARRSLARDLRGDTPPLIDLESAQREAPAPELLAETARVRAVRPAKPRIPGHVVVEPREGALSFFESDSELLLELLEHAREIARKLATRPGALRLEIDPAERPLRVHLLPRD